MERRALIIGVDKYQQDYVPNLNACVNDAQEMIRALSYNHDKSRNFECKPLLNEDVTRTRLRDEIDEIFKKAADTVIIYFAGHGIFDESADHGYLVSTDAVDAAWGVSLDTLLSKAKVAYNNNIHNTVIILDCCYAGRLGEPGSGTGGVAELGKGVTIMTACSQKETAIEKDDQGIFTATILDGLMGGAKDLEGNVTPAMLYAHVDRHLGAFEQRPLFKANIQTFNVLRKAKAEVNHEQLRQLYTFFKDDSGGVYSFGPECEPHKDRGTYQEKHKDIPFDEKAQKPYRLLQEFNRKNLVEPHEQIHMWDAAMESTGCKLTNLGKTYFKLAKKGKFGPVDI